MCALVGPCVQTQAQQTMRGAGIGKPQLEYCLGRMNIEDSAVLEPADRVLTHQHDEILEWKFQLPLRAPGQTGRMTGLTPLRCTHPPGPPKHLVL